MDNNPRQMPPNLRTSDRNRTLYTALAIAAVVGAGFTLWAMTEEAPNMSPQTNVARTN